MSNKSNNFKNDRAMKKTIVVYGSTTGTCQEFAEQIA